MLTADLIVARVVKGELKPRYLPAHDPQALALAAELIEVFRSHLHRTSEALDGALATLLGEDTEFLLHRGLAKLLRDRAEFEVRAPCDPATLRRRLFEEAAAHHPAVAVADAVHTVTRGDVIAKVARELGIDASVALDAMYGDLKDHLVMTSAPEVSPEALIARYNVALVQAALLRATSMVIHIEAGDPARYRQLFRYVKFFRLMHRVSGSAAQGYVITLDGPASLFTLSHKYGLQLAEFFPALLLCTAWKATAHLLWGKDKRSVTLHLSPALGLVSHYPDKGVYVTREEQSLLDRFAELDTPWKLERRVEVIDLGGRGVLVPEFVMTHTPSQRVALIDVMGFWHKNYLEARLALLREHGPRNLVLVVPARLRGDREALEGAVNEVMFYKDVMIAKELIERAERVAIATSNEGRLAR